MTAERKQRLGEVAVVEGRDARGDELVAEPREQIAEDERTPTQQGMSMAALRHPRRLAAVSGSSSRSTTVTDS